MVKKLMTYFLERRMADEEKTELLTAFTHDMKTPLAVIKTGLQNLIDGIGGTLNNMHREMAQICATAVNRATDFVNQILEISKVKISMLSLRRELIDFQQIVKDEVKEISALAQKNNQTVNCQIMTTDPKVWGDREKLSRAVMNLLSNAVKYTNIDGRIDVLVSSDENTVKLAVINTGPGIPADKLGAIFNKYERLEPNSKIEGTGLGLSIVKDIIDLHKGHITVKSELGKETEFDVVLPKDLRTAVRR
jgi:signal transduction histidine kinase